jgi:hypothetical protein
MILISGYDMQQMKRITLMLPIDLLERSRAVTGKDIRSTIREGLEGVVASRAHQALRRLRGKVKLSIIRKSPRD